MKTLAKSFIGILCVLAFTAGSAGAVTKDFTVDSQAMPWLSTPPAITGLNYPFFFYGLQDGSSPTIVDASRGFSFAPGGTFSITYLRGLTSPFGGLSGTFGDANGLNGILGSFAQATKYYAPYPVVYNSPGLGNYYPTLYTHLDAVDPISTYWLACLVGTFVDSKGTIVGQPFFIGDGPSSFMVPAGATRLQLGINDDLFGDNVGALLVSVSGPGPVPVPATSLLFGSGLLGLVGLKRKFHG